MKVDVWRREGWVATAYLDDEDFVADPNHIYLGQWKHTDDDMACVWIDAAEVFVEVER